MTHRRGQKRTRARMADRKAAAEARPKRTPEQRTVAASTREKRKMSKAGGY